MVAFCESCRSHKDKTLDASQAFLFYKAVTESLLSTSQPYKTKTGGHRPSVICLGKKLMRQGYRSVATKSCRNCIHPVQLPFILCSKFAPKFSYSEEISCDGFSGILTAVLSNLSATPDTKTGESHQKLTCNFTFNSFRTDLSICQRNFCLPWLGSV